MAHLVRVVVLLVVGLYLLTDLAQVDPDGPGILWAAGLVVLWSAVFLLFSWIDVPPPLAWGAVGLGVLCAGLSWWLTPTATPALGELAQFTWPGAATVGAGAVAGRILVVARSWTGRIPAALVAITVTGAALADPLTRTFFLLDTGLILACCFTVAAAAILQRHRIEAERQVAVAQERQRLADELHDRIAHEVTGIVVLAQGSAALAANGPVQRPLELIEASGLRAMEHIRAIVGRSGPRLSHEPEENDTGEAHRRIAEPVESVTDVSDRLASLVADFAGTTSAAVHGPGEVDAVLTPPAWDLVERGIREALTNVRRHAASARHVRVHAAADENTLTVWVTDDGDGGGLGTGGGSGLRGLTRRLRALGGELTAGPGSSGGWQVCLCVPVAPRSIEHERLS